MQNMVNILRALCIYISLQVASLTSSTSFSPAPAPAPAVGGECESLVLSMMDCIDYLSENGGQSKPSISCCQGFKTVLKTDAECICSGIQEASTMGIDIDFKKAANLPSLCGVTNAPPISKCNISIAPAPAPLPFAPLPTPSAPLPPPAGAHPPKVAPAPTTSPTAGSLAAPPALAEAPASPAPKRCTIAGNFLIPLFLFFLRFAQAFNLYYLGPAV